MRSVGCEAVANVSRSASIENGHKQLARSSLVPRRPDIGISVHLEREAYAIRQRSSAPDVVKFGVKFGPLKGEAKEEEEEYTMPAARINNITEKEEVLVQNELRLCSDCCF